MSSNRRSGSVDIGTMSNDVHVNVEDLGEVLYSINYKNQ